MKALPRTRGFSAANWRILLTDNLYADRPLRRAMNAALISVMDLKVEGRPEDISLAEILGNMDASSYLVVFISIAVTLMVGVGSGMLFVSIWPNASQIPLIASLPAIVLGFITCWLLFRIRRWLKS